MVYISMLNLRTQGNRSDFSKRLVKTKTDPALEWQKKSENMTQCQFGNDLRRESTS